jgi:hypothetical protein
MVVCIIAMVVFAIMGIFSAKYRTYAKEAGRCVFRMVTLRPCDTEFDQRVKSKITAKLMTKSPKAAGFIYKRFNLISWIFVVIFFVSIAFTANSVYNLYVYGTCDPYTGDCIFNPGPTCNLPNCNLENCTCGTTCTEQQLIDCGCKAPPTITTP